MILEKQRKAIFAALEHKNPYYSVVWVNGQKVVYRESTKMEKLVESIKGLKPGEAAKIQIKRERA